MTEDENHLISLQIHQAQFENLYKMFLEIVFEREPKRMVDLLHRTIQLPFRKKSNQLALILLDKSRQNILVAFLITVRSGGDIKKINTIPLNLQYQGQSLSNIFKVKGNTFNQSVNSANSLIKANYGSLWTLMVIDFNQISKLFFILDFKPTKKLIGKLAKTVIDRIKDETIKLRPIPEVVDALEKMI